jgi:hypothetical protein
MERAHVPILVRMRALVVALVVVAAVGPAQADRMPLGMHQHFGSLGPVTGTRLPLCNAVRRSQAFVYEEDEDTHIRTLRETTDGGYRIIVEGNNIGGDYHAPGDGVVLVGIRDVVLGNHRVVTRAVIYRSRDGVHRDIAIRRWEYDLWIPDGPGHERCGPHWQQTCEEWWSGPSMGP